MVPLALKDLIIMQVVLLRLKESITRTPRQCGNGGLMCGLFAAKHARNGRWEAFRRS